MSNLKPPKYHHANGKGDPFAQIDTTNANLSYGGNISKVAEALGLSRAALYRRFEKFGIKT